MVLSAYRAAIPTAADGDSFPGSADALAGIVFRVVLRTRAAPPRKRRLPGSAGVPARASPQTPMLPGVACVRASPVTSRGAATRRRGRRRARETSRHRRPSVQRGFVDPRGGLPQGDSMKRFRHVAVLFLSGFARVCGLCFVGAAVSVSECAGESLWAVSGSIPGPSWRAGGVAIRCGRYRFRCWRRCCRGRGRGSSAAALVRLQAMCGRDARAPGQSAATLPGALRTRRTDARP